MHEWFELMHYQESKFAHRVEAWLQMQCAALVEVWPNWWRSE